MTATDTTGTVTLAGVRVVELGTGSIAPIVGMLLADHGADVVRFGGPPVGALSPQEAFRHRSKRLVASPPTPEEAAVLLGAADLCVAGPGGGIDSERRDTILRENPRLVWLDLPLWDGPAPWGDVESHGLLAAWTGMAARQTSFSGDPVEPVYDLLFSSHAAWAAACAVACLVERERSGFGQRVTVSAAHGMLLPLIGVLSVDADIPDPSTAIGSFGRHPTYTVFECGDGRWLACGALGSKFERAILNVLGIESILDDPRLGGGTASYSAPDVFAWVRSEVAAAFRTRDCDDWVERISAAGIPCGPVGHRDDWLDRPQVAALGERVELAVPGLGTLTMPGTPNHLPSSAGAPVAAPRAVELGEVGWTPRPAPAVTGPAPLRPGPLAGIRILNTGSFVAGPYSGSLMAELGAEVVKLEPTGGDPFRQTGFMYSRGMRSIAIDLASAEGREILDDLAGTCDVVICSLRPGAERKLGLDHETLASRRPDIITTGISGFGEVGPQAGRPGVDMVLQAMSGMMRAQGGDDEPVVNTLAITDFNAAALTCLGAVLALYHRAQTGGGQHIWTSLADVATYTQGAGLVKLDGKPVSTLNGGRDYKGTGCADRYYRVADGWLRVAGRDRDALDPDELIAAGIDVDKELFARDRVAAVASALADLGAKEAADRLARAGLAAVPARRVTEVLRDPLLLASGRIEVRAGEEGTVFTAPGRYAAFGRTALSGHLVTPGAGQHTRALLAELYPAERIEELLRAGVVEAGAPMPQRLGAVYR
ncbi:CoA transferase [Actinomadura sp. LD22]|uniref:CoA transferase n=1 Tax=Actinomadura physcomitrii TaxID=2650748 RepID=A0A6I4MCT0_9ACTN|nr:CoA transferase [Actinomadura physcomitrii]MWA01581.1 CoA transferase [Actinomadura physcomitrii]